MKTVEITEAISWKGIYGRWMRQEDFEITQGALLASIPLWVAANIDQVTIDAMIEKCKITAQKHQTQISSTTSPQLILEAYIFSKKYPGDYD